MLEKIRRVFRKKQDSIEFTETNISFQERLEALEKYFERQAVINDSFQPEYEAACRVNALALKDYISERDIIEIIAIFNEANIKPHYNGAGWQDFRYSLLLLIDSKGMNAVIPTDKCIQLVPVE